MKSQIKSPQSQDEVSKTAALRKQVADRFGILPDFFCLAPQAPDITANLWGFAQFAYLDNPLPSLFKERLFVYLSRFCDVRYCIARHVGFLIGLGRPSGDRACVPNTIPEVVRLLRHPLPRGSDLRQHIARLGDCSRSEAELLGRTSEYEESIIACASHVFLQTPEAESCLKVLERVLDGGTLQRLMVFLAFVRAAHYWTKLHPELAVEDDIKQLLAIHQELADCVLNDPEARSCETTERLVDELESLRRESGEALRQSRERVDAVFDQAAVGILVADLDGRLTEANPRLCQMLHRDCDDLCGMTCEQLTHPDDWSRSSMLIREVIAGTRTEFSMEKRYLRANGAWLWVNVAATPLRDAGGRVMQLLAVVVDISARKDVEEKLREADRRKDEFLATLAHELRNPLAPLRNSLDILRMTGAEDDVRARTRLHAMMERQVIQLVRLVDDLLEVSRITRGKIEIRKEPITAAAVVRTAVETSKPLIDAAHHQLAVALPTDPLILDADPVRLSQVLTNLLNNAAKYTPGGGQICVTVRRDGSNVVLSVRDTGVGIAPDMLPKVFELFTQVGSAYGRAQGGLGIGLTLVRSLVELHGGTVEAHSDGPGQGSEFIVTLPLSHASRMAEPGMGQESVPSFHAQRVLVVDDNIDGADSLGLMLLKRFGCEVRIAYDGENALELIAAFRPSFVFLDIGMPGMDGYELARRIRQMFDGAGPTLIALTGWGHAEDRRRSKSAGIDHHLVKPINLTALQSVFAFKVARE